MFVLIGGQNIFLVFVFLFLEVKKCESGTVRVFLWVKVHVAGFLDQGPRPKARPKGMSVVPRK